MISLPDAADGGGRTLTRRDLAKQRTRERLLDAARRLFVERGYEATTIRDIAALAGFSTGAVFANFSDKAELFEGVVKADCEALDAHLKTIGLDRGSIHHALTAVIDAVHEVHIKQPGIIQAVVSLSWQPDGAGVRRDLTCREPVVSRLAEILRRGVETRDLSASLDVEVAAEMLWDSYLSNCQRVIFEGWDDQTLRARRTQQIEILLAGYRKAAA
jgi:AcrR family transcriptional regulator